MTIVRDDSDEHRTRVERMIDEFREAQSRRSGRQNDKAVESKPDPNTKAPLTESATSK